MSIFSPEELQTRSYEAVEALLAFGFVEPGVE